MDDDVCVCREYTRLGKNGGKTGGCACTSTLESVNVYRVASCMQPCQTTAFSLLQLIILLTVDLSRGPGSELKPILVIVVIFMYKK